MKNGNKKRQVPSKTFYFHSTEKNKRRIKAQKPRKNITKKKQNKFTDKRCKSLTSPCEELLLS